MDANREFINSQLSFNTLADGSFPEVEGDFKHSIKMNNKPKIPMSYYFSESQSSCGPNYNILNQNQNSNIGVNYEANEQKFEPLIGYKNMMGHMSMSNIKNMNINIINQVPIQPGLGNNHRMQGNFDNEEFTSNFSKLNLRNETGYGNSKKDMAYNYYFGHPGGDSSNININYDNPGIPIPTQNLPKELQLSYENQNFLNQKPISSGHSNKLYEQRNNMGLNSNQHINMDTTNKGKYSNEKNHYNRGQFNKGFTNNGNKNNGNGFNNRNKYSLENNSEQNMIQGPKKYAVGTHINMQPSNLDNNLMGRYFVMKSIDEDNIHKSIKYRIWCSTIKGNQKLQKAFKEADNKYPIYLFFSVNGSGRFLGLAQMTSEVEYRANFNYWTQNEKWKGFFFVVWLTIKDVPNRAFRHLINEYNDNKSVTASRDTQEIHPIVGAEMLKVFTEFPYETSILDDFKFYEQKQDNQIKFDPIQASKLDENSFTSKSIKNESEHSQNITDMIRNSPPEVENSNSFFQPIIKPLIKDKNFDVGFKDGGFNTELFSNTQKTKPIKMIIKRINSTENIMNSRKEENY